ncbi:hypothetical protein GXP67_32620 [Rhodocytophaga rosea]|uniref:Lipoprotein n=1 Tax=Rhodocytophaga rosea TaxID=2704465 RepID=A0A6C0GUP6_9BACT|nr:hypothetical protein [Rhodocytophaga rosea]QHT71060.1 hypothetical protein GXP67_32620 [Rhodocytophaga rosea]
MKKEIPLPYVTYVLPQRSDLAFTDLINKLPALKQVYKRRWHPESLLNKIRKCAAPLLDFSKMIMNYTKGIAAFLSVCMLYSCETKTVAKLETEPKAIVKAQVIDSTAIIAARKQALADSLRKDSIRLAELKDSEIKKIEPSAPVEWPKLPDPLPGSILPEKRIIAFYGNPLSKRMGILGELPPDDMLAKLDEEIEAWKKADPETPIQPALHVIMVTAQGAPGRDKKYRLRMTDKVAEDVIAWAAKRDAIVFIDIQIGHSTLQDEIPRLAHLLSRPNVHFAIDAEFAMREDHVPGDYMGVFDAEDINYATSYLADLVAQHNLPPKVFVVHRFTQKMITNADKIKLDPRVQIVMHMDGWGSGTLKKDTYRRYIVREPVQYTGFKLFYKNDTRNGWSLMKPEDVLSLNPKPLYIQYQ